MKKSIIGLALLAAMGAGSVNAQSSEGWNYNPDNNQLTITGDVTITDDNLYTILGYEDNKKPIYNTKTTVKTDGSAVKVYKRTIAFNELEILFEWGVDYSYNNLQKKLKSALSDWWGNIQQDRVDKDFVGYKDVQCFDTETTTEKVGEIPAALMGESGRDVVINPDAILRINQLTTKKETFKVQNHGRIEQIADARVPFKTDGFFDYLSYYYLLGWIAGNVWYKDVQVLYTMENGQPVILYYNVPGRHNETLPYVKYDEGGEGEVVDVNYEVGNVVAINSLTICSETDCSNNNGEQYSTRSGQFYNINYKPFDPTTTDMAETEIFPETRIREAMSKLRIGQFYVDDNGIMKNGAPDIRFQKTFTNTKGMFFYPLAIPFYTSSKEEVIHNNKSGQYNVTYYIGMYSGAARANGDAGGEFGTWKEVTDNEADFNEHGHRTFTAGFTGYTDMPQYRAYEVLFAEGGINVITFKNQATLEENLETYTKGLIPYYMANCGTYVFKNQDATSADFAQLAVWKQPLYGDDINNQDDYWHFFSNPLPYNVKIVKSGHFYDKGMSNMGLASSCAELNSFSGQSLTRQGGKYHYDDNIKTADQTVFKVGEPFFAKSRVVLLDPNAENPNAFIESDYIGEQGESGQPSQEAIFTFEPALTNMATRSQQYNEDPITTITVEEKATGYIDRTFIQKDENALENQSEEDAFGMVSTGTLNIWTNRDKKVLAIYGYNPDVETTIPVAMSTYNAGEHIISVENIPNGVELWLYKAGKPVCCLNESVYTFNAPKSSKIDDFTLVTRGTTDGPTANEEISANEQNIRAYMVGSTCRIEGLEVGMTYNVYAINGATVANGTAHANVANVALPTPGVYVVKVVSTNNEEQVIKIKY